MCYKKLKVNTNLQLFLKFISMKDAPLSQRQQELVDAMRAYPNSYVSYSETIGFCLILNGDVRGRVSAATVAALEKKRLITKDGDKFRLWKKANSSTTDLEAP